MASVVAIEIERVCSSDEKLGESVLAVKNWVRVCGSSEKLGESVVAVGAAPWVRSLQISGEGTLYL